MQVRGWYDVQRVRYGAATQQLCADPRRLRDRAVFSGAAPVSQDTLSYFQSLFLPINEL